jgi:hypothetical protein
MFASGGVLNLIAGLVLAVSAPTGQQVSSGTHSPHGNLNIPCQNCHTANAWRPIRAVPEFDHNQTKYPLRGMHKAVACTQCHIKGVFTDVGQRCQDCHADIHKRQLGANCEQCHTVRGWQVAIKDVEQHTNRFPLTGAHAAVDCDACHKSAATSQFQTMSTDCYSCHAADYLSASNPKHTAQAFPEQNCNQCHTTDNWLNAKFDHSATGFPLTGQHTVPPRQCTDCHVNNNYNLTNTTCVSCHLKDFQNTNNPPHVAGGFSQTCETCHTTSAWEPATFDHSKTAFPLTGSHTVPPRLCTDCHVNNNYNITNTTCISCHQTDFNNATSPVPHAGFPTTCQNCHDTVQWTDGKFDHSTTGFPLTGQHTVPPRQCTDCHVNNNYNLNSTACVTCHLKDYQGTTNPNHVATNIPQTCDQCHSTSSWLNATFNHNNTGFPLTGSHTVPPRACTDCHVNNNYNITNTTCVSCHQTDYNNATTPVNHPAAGFPTTCETCHDTVAWTDGTFNHSSTGFALTGQHTVPPRLCTDCHVNNNYNITVTTCVSCHLKDYQGTTNPNHVTANFPQTCDQCHSTSTWLNATFNHNSTGFPLTGSHTVPPRQCTDCHVNNNYNITNTTCVSCHQTDYTNAISPVNHPAAGFPTTCQNCHDTVAWTDGTFNHSSTGFTLTGSHTVPPRQCTDCHVNNNYNITSTTCVSCHQTDYNNATTPVNHVAAAFPTTCDTCHDTVAWTDATFNHTSTGFTLTGAHTVPPRLCTDCHVNNNYSLNSTACVTCHLKDYQGTTNPNHATAGFPQQCDLCHDTTVWTDSTFNHNNTAFPLTGSHTVPPRQCTDCHVNGNYTTLPTTCIGCHQTDYNNATNPGHAAQPQFFPSAQCSTCHNTTAWTGATFNHTQYTQFPINHGNAGGVCSTCHTNSNDYSVFQCTGCHGGNNAANFHHEQVNGYVYNSINCYQCHSSGGGG